MKEETNNITFEDLLSKVSLIYNSNTLDKINEAFDYASKKHQNKLRNSGDEFITHPLNVAYILADLNVDATTIIASLLHEVLDEEATNEKVTKKEIEKIFGEDVANLCENLNRINKLEMQGDSEQDAIHFRKILVGLAEDVRVLFIRLADRLHNMKTLWALKETKQKATAYETLEVLIPIAHRLGINSIKSELEDLCLKYTKPEIYNDILNHLTTDREHLQELLNEMIESISDILTEQGIKFEIKGRVKSVHSIYKKLSTGRNYNDIYDILALRIFVENESDCYSVMGLIHAKYRAIPKRFKDYIAKPKANMYQSLHTSVFGIDGNLFEIQIRTYEMDEIAEKGIASHWSYKEKGTKNAQNIMEQKLELFRSLIESSKEFQSDTEFINQVNSEFLSDLIYVYTPKGDVVELPKNATPVDFAYRIHSNVGDTTVGAIVNDKIATLDSALNDGDIVEIKTNKATIPNKEWLNFVKTSQAKNKIKAYFSKNDRVEYISKGEIAFEKEARKRKLQINELLNEQNIEKLKNDLKLKSLEEIYLSIGSLRYTPSYIIELISEDKKNVKDILIEKVVTNKNNNQDYKNDVIVAGSGDILVTMAKCCKPILGDKIIGYITKGQGISVHNQNCPNIKNEHERIITVDWNPNSDNLYLTDIYLEVANDKNYMLDIITRASLKECFIEDFRNFSKDTTNIIELTVKIKNTKELDAFITDLSRQKYIIQASREKI